MKKIFIVVLAITFLGASCVSNQQASEIKEYADGQINLAGRSVSFELAKTAAEKTKGLSGRASIEENQGMLFMFPTPDFLVFWMKDMNFPIDIVWIKGDEVVDVSASVPNEPGVPDTQLKTYLPKVPADRVLELKAGWAERNGLKIGDKVEIIQTVNSH